MGDKWLNGCLVPYMKNIVFETNDKKAKLKYFQVVGSRKIEL